MVFEASFEAAVAQLGGYQRLDSVLFPVIDSLYADPFGFPVVEDGWIPFCRYAVTKPTLELPAFIVVFTIDEEMVSLRDIFENEDY
ncbi:MAG TPA: hypothetical protein VM755_22130 [Stellaceae bacterium]|nr:hypothetical protein [Stellaceae bacterium]